MYPRYPRLTEDLSLSLEANVLGGFCPREEAVERRKNVTIRTDPQSQARLRGPRLGKMRRLFPLGFTHLSSHRSPTAPLAPP